MGQQAARKGVNNQGIARIPRAVTSGWRKDRRILEGLSPGCATRSPHRRRFAVCGELTAALKIRATQAPTAGFGLRNGASGPPGRLWRAHSGGPELAISHLRCISSISYWTILIYRSTISPSTREVGFGRNRNSQACCGAAAHWWGNHPCNRVGQSVFEISGEQMKARPREDVMVMSTPEVRRQLKIIGAVTGSTMKGVLGRLVAEEFKRVTRVAQRTVTS